MMIDLLLQIPESVGWTIVGVLAAICCLLIFQVARTFIKMWKYRHEVDEEGENWRKTKEVD